MKFSINFGKGEGSDVTQCRLVPRSRQLMKKVNLHRALKDRLLTTSEVRSLGPRCRHDTAPTAPTAYIFISIFVEIYVKVHKHSIYDSAKAVFLN